MTFTAIVFPFLGTLGVLVIAYLSSILYQSYRIKKLIDNSDKGFEFDKIAPLYQESALSENLEDDIMDEVIYPPTPSNLPGVLPGTISEMPPFEPAFSYDNDSLPPLYSKDEDKKVK